MNYPGETNLIIRILKSREILPAIVSQGYEDCKRIKEIAVLLALKIVGKGGHEPGNVSGI